MSKRRKRIEKDSVIRVNAEIRKRIEKLREDFNGKKLTMNEMMEKVLDVAEQFQGAKLHYTNELFSDVTEARGDAVIKAVRSKSVLKLPRIVVVVGEDAP